MSYNFHIERLRPDAESWMEEAVLPISLEEWRAAVSQVENARLQTDDHVVSNAANPSQKIKMPVREGTVEIYLPQEDLWSPAITWRGTSAVFRAPAKNDSSDPLWSVAVQLAQLLNARIRGQEAELYCLTTGKVVAAGPRR
jgi:hypothetical protein